MATDARRRAARARATAGQQRFEGRMAELERLLGDQRAQLEGRLGDQEERLAAQQAEIERLRAQLAEERSGPTPSTVPPGRPRSRAAGGPDRSNGHRASRRTLLRLGGAAAAAGVAAGAIELWKPASARAAGARTQSVTLYESATGGGNYAIEGDGFSDLTGNATGIIGTSNGGVGVEGSSNVTGVYGHSPLGFGVFGVTGGASSTPPPGLSYGVLGRNAQGTAVLGDARTGGTGIGRGVEGYSDTAVGVLGNSASYDGVQGYADAHSGVFGQSNSGAGLWGHSASGVGLHADCASGDAIFASGGRYGMAVQGTLAPIHFSLPGTAGAPTTGTHAQGELYADSTAALWVCVAAGTPGSWQRLPGVQPGYLGGAVNLLPVAIRLLDTRGGPGIGYHATAQFQAAGVGAIPAGAVAVFGHLIAALTPGVNCGDGSSAICWPAGQMRPAAVNIVYDPQDLQGAYTGTLTLVAVGAGGKLNLYSQPILPVSVGYIFDCFGFVM